VLIPPSVRHGESGKAMDPRMDVDLAYVLTTHKTQGSEYATVCYVMNQSRSFNLNRHNFYTAVTRARNIVHVISDRSAMQKSLAKYHGV
jgi:exodeoxyribonuclease V alpha subunit